MLGNALSLVYGTLLLIGGVVGFLRGSSVSLAMGAVSALWVFFAEFTYKSAVSASKADGAFRAAVALLLLSTVLAVMMGLRFRDSGKVFPAGVVALLSVGMTLLYASRAFAAFDQGAGIKKD